MKTLCLIMGLVLLVSGILIKYFNEYLARKQEGLHRRGFKKVNLYWPLVGPSPTRGPAFIITGLGLLLLYFLKEFQLL